MTAAEFSPAEVPLLLIHPGGFFIPGVMELASMPDRWHPASQWGNPKRFSLTKKRFGLSEKRLRVLSKRFLMT
jgi:hypothetical protein